MVAPRHENEPIIEELHVHEWIQLYRELVDGDIHDAIPEAVFKVYRPSGCVKAEGDGGLRIGDSSSRHRVAGEPDRRNRVAPRPKFTAARATRGPSPMRLRPQLNSAAARLLKSVGQAHPKVVA